MATSKKPAAKAKKPVAKAAAKPAPKAAAKKPAPKKPAPKAVSKPAPKAAAKAAPKASVSVVKPAPKLHSVAGGKRANAPTPAWMQDACKLAQQNPAVTLVALIVGALGIVLMFG